MANSLAHPYWTKLENPRLSQLRAPAPNTAPPSRPDPRHTGRVLRPAGSEHLVPLAEFLAQAVSEELVAQRRAEIDAVNARIARQHVPAGYMPGDGEADWLSFHEPCRIDADEPLRVLKPREPHKDVKSRSKWKKRPGTFKSRSQARLIGGREINR